MAATSTMYSGIKTGAGNTVPTFANGGVNINALMASMVSRDIWTYYSTLKIAASTTYAASYTLFNQVAGNQDTYAITANQVLSHVETNMPSPASNGFSAPRDLIMDNLGFYFKPGGCGLASQGVGTFAQPADLITFCQYSYFEFKIIDKVFIEGYLELNPSGNGFTGMSTQVQTGIWTLGTANPHAKMRMNNFSKYLAPLMQWSLVIYFPSGSGPAGVSAVSLATTAGGVGFWLVANISGLTDRAVQ